MFGVSTLTLTHFLTKAIFSRGYGGVHETCGNFGGVGGSILSSKNGNSSRNVGDLREIPYTILPGENLKAFFLL